MPGRAEPGRAGPLINGSASPLGTSYTHFLADRGQPRRSPLAPSPPSPLGHGEDAARLMGRVTAEVRALPQEPAVRAAAPAQTSAAKPRPDACRRHAQTAAQLAAGDEVRRTGHGPAVWARPARRWWAGPCSTGGTTTAAAARRIHGRPHPARVGAALRCMTEAALLDAAPYGTRFALLLLALAPGLARARALRPRRAGPSPPLPQGPARTQLVGHVARHTSVSLPGLALPGAASCDQGQSIGAECLFADYRLRVMVSACRHLQVSELVAAEEGQASAGHSVRLSVGLPAPGRVARSRDKGLALCASAGEL